MGEIIVDPKGVIKLLNNLNIHKAPGPDGLSARVLKECSSKIATVLTYIFNESLAQGAVWYHYNETPTAKVEKVQRTAAWWNCRRWRNTSSFGEMLDELEWPSLESRRERSSLTFFFFKIHSGTVSLDKDKYPTPAPNLRHTRDSHESQYTRPFAYSDALKNSFFPQNYSGLE